MIPLPPTALCITAMECVTPLGFDAAQTCAAIRAGVNRFADHPFHVSLTQDPETEAGEPLVASLLSELDADLEGPERLVELAVPTFKGLLAKAGFKRGDLARGGLLLSLPLLGTEPEKSDGGQDFPTYLTRKLGIDSLKMKKSCRLGQTGMATCMLEASKLLASGEIDFCMVAGLETYHDTDRLNLLDESYRLKSQRAVDGFIPGEGAVVFVLETAAKAKARKARPLGILSDFGFGTEPRNYASEVMSSGQGLGQALQPALTKPVPVVGKGRWILCDLNGESYRAAEWGLVRTRLGEKVDPIAALTHPADCLGDMGAASTGILVAYALHAFARGFAPAQQALIWNASDDGGRSALVLTSVESD